MSRKTPVACPALLFSACPLQENPAVAGFPAGEKAVRQVFFAPVTRRAPEGSTADPAIGNQQYAVIAPTLHCSSSRISVFRSRLYCMVGSCVEVVPLMF